MKSEPTYSINIKTFYRKVKKRTKISSLNIDGSFNQDVNEDDSHENDLDSDELPNDEISDANDVDDIIIQTTEGKLSIKNKKFRHVNIDSIDIQTNENIFIDLSSNDDGNLHNNDDYQSKENVNSQNIPSK